MWLVETHVSWPPTVSLHLMNYRGHHSVSCLQISPGSPQDSCWDCAPRSQKRFLRFSHILTWVHLKQDSFSWNVSEVTINDSNFQMTLHPDNRRFSNTTSSGPGVTKLLLRLWIFHNLRAAALNFHMQSTHTRRRKINAHTDKIRLVYFEGYIPHICLKTVKRYRCIILKTGFYIKDTLLLSVKST